MPVFQSCEALQPVIRQWKEAGDRIVVTSGVFDIVHRGHLETLQRAREFGDRLVVAVNADESVRRKKGPLRPINRLEDRLFMLAALRAVDAAIGFNEDGEQPIALINAIRPDVFVKASGDWSEKTFFFKQQLEQLGGKAELVGHTPGYSTSRLIARIIDLYGQGVKPKLDQSA
jgi:rfaE bifunctional protein nucleotidyltransferase chain/domain